MPKYLALLLLTVRSVQHSVIKPFIRNLSLNQGCKAIGINADFSFLRPVS
jgi:hypothetical protein